MVYRLSVGYFVVPNLPRVMIHVIQRQLIRGISADGVTVHLNIRDIFPSCAAPTGNAPNVAAARTLEENEYYHPNEQNEGEHSRSDQDYKSGIVLYPSLDVSDVRNASIGNHHHSRRPGSSRCHGRKCDSLALSRDARMDRHTTLTCSNGRMNCHAIILGFVTNH